MVREAINNSLASIIITHVCVRFPVIEYGWAEPVGRPMHILHNFQMTHKADEQKCTAS